MTQLAESIETEPPRNAPNGTGEPARRGADSRKESGLLKADIICASIVFVLMAVLKAFYVRALHWHSDEAQHLHVAWGWSAGYLPYRDFFDNHSPLFGHLMSYILPLFGERDDIVDWMRLPMLPLFVASLWLLYKLGASVFSPRAGLWAVVLGGLYPQWFLKMGEFRTDVLWTTLWLAELVILTGGRLTARRLFFSGLVLGAAFSVSMKTTLMLATIWAAGGGALWLCRWISPLAFERISWSGWTARAGAWLGGLLIVPGAFIAFYAAHGALREMYYCIIQHNLVPGAQTSFSFFRHLRTPLMLVVVAAFPVAWVAVKDLLASDPERAFRRVFVIMVVFFFSPILVVVWSHVTPQDYMPVWPLFGLLAAPCFIWLGARCSSPRLATWVPIALCLVVTAAETGLIISTHPLLDRPNSAGREVIHEALLLTRPGEFIMDPKGESVYRPRPYYYVLETLTRHRIEHGLIPDDLPQRLIETQTAVAIPTKRMSSASYSFVEENYLPIGALSVLGKRLKTSESGVYRFDIVIPSTYALVSSKGRVDGDLDGSPLVGPRYLAAGPHEFRKSSGKGDLAVIWERAIEKGFDPFRCHYFYSPPDPAS